MSIILNSQCMIQSDNRDVKYNVNYSVHSYFEYFPLI